MVYLVFHLSSMISKQHFYAPDNLIFGVLVEVVKVGSKVRFVTLKSQKMPAGVFISCSYRDRRKFPLGSILEIDCRLVTPMNRKPFLRIIGTHPLSQYQLFNCFLIHTPHDKPNLI